MQEALSQANLARALGEVPVGAVVVKDGQVLGRGHNRVITDSDPSAHAEIVALRAAGRVLNNYRLIGCELYVTIEPCAMCAGALVHARLARLIYGAEDPKAGAVCSTMQVINGPSSNHKMEIKDGVLAAASSELLQAFFRERRRGGPE
jgi:tRNA(adenine34) deaminase